MKVGSEDVLSDVKARRVSFRPATVSTWILFGSKGKTADQRCARRVCREKPSLHQFASRHRRIDPAGHAAAVMRNWIITRRSSTLGYASAGDEIRNARRIRSMQPNSFALVVLARTSLLRLGLEKV
jgi:hypothetical protein